MRMRAARALALAAALLLASCAPAPVSPPAPSSSAGYALPAATAAWYRDAASKAAVLRIDPVRSTIVVTVRRGGALARLGHDHVVASHAIAGLVAPNAGRADFGFRLDQLVVDEAPLRAQARLDTQPSPEAIAGTRTNMLARVLEAERYPEVTLAVQGAPVPEAGGSATVARTTLTLAITLHGVTRSVPAEAQISRTAGELTASGALLLRQSDFGITPMSIMNGAMTVQDQMELRYTIVATPSSF
ncbi:MAG: YceI family protein [Massilia sp.]